jgi:CRISPR-associated protein Csm2
MYPKDKLKKEWIQDKITDEAVEWAKSFGEYLTKEDSLNPLTTSQIRRFFGELKRIQADPEKYKEEIPMLKAKLAYAVGRDTTTFRGQIQNKTKIKEFYEELEKGINYIRTENLKGDVIRFVKLVESIVAFHKFFGGK